MERRKLLATTGLAIPTALAGCVNSITGNENKKSETWSPEVTISESSIQASETTVLTMEVTDVAGIQIRPDPHSDAITFDFNGTNLTPSPESTYQMYPPGWQWGTRTSIEIEQPITVADDTHPHEYTGEVRVIADAPSNESENLEGNESVNNEELETLTKEFVVTIIE